MEASCSVDQAENAVTCCGCKFPIPTLCGPCRDKHLQGPGSHFLLPLSASQDIKSNRDFTILQTRIVQLNHTYNEFQLVLAEITRCEEQIEAVYQEMIVCAANVKAKFLMQLQTMKTTYFNVMNSAVQETSNHATEGKNYIPGHPITYLIWNHDLDRPDELGGFAFHAECVTDYVEKAFNVAFCISTPGLEDLNLGEVPTPIYLSISTDQSVAEKLQLEVKSCDLISSVKAKIEEQKGYPRNLQTLMLNGKRLKDMRTLADYQITSESPLHLELYNRRVGLKILTEESTVRLELKTDSTIKEVKENIPGLEGISHCRKILCYSGKELADDRTLGDYEIKTGMKLNYSTRPDRNIEITVRRQFLDSTSDITLNVKGSSTVDAVKTQASHDGFCYVFKRIQLVFSGKQLTEDWRTLDEYDVPTGAMFELLYK